MQFTLDESSDQVWRSFQTAIAEVTSELDRYDYILYVYKPCDHYLVYKHIDHYYSIRIRSLISPEQKGNEIDNIVALKNRMSNIQKC